MSEIPSNNKRKREEPEKEQVPEHENELQGAKGIFPNTKQSKTLPARPSREELRNLRWLHFWKLFGSPQKGGGVVANTKRAVEPRRLSSFFSCPKKSKRAQLSNKASVPSSSSAQYSRKLAHRKRTQLSKRASTTDFILVHR